ncbi:DUF982 domain-containing protein [Neorhizobium sp. T6_25]|uniref:DUF982 domain-containing protein n=1 Tax=Neorhizobium sp. T6_25 TaxID=2093833 RepID=UPI000CF9E841
MTTRRRMGFSPVKFRLAGDGRYRVVRDAHDAIKVLATEWPVDNSPAMSRATLACLKSFNDDAEPDDVRRAFIAAAREAHIDVAA